MKAIKEMEIILSNLKKEMDERIKEMERKIVHDTNNLKGN